MSDTKSASRHRLIQPLFRHRGFSRSRGSATHHALSSACGFGYGAAAASRGFSEVLFGGVICDGG